MHCSTRYLMQCPAGRNSTHGQGTAPQSIGTLRPDGHHDMQSRISLAPEKAAGLALGLSHITGQSGRVITTRELIEGNARMAAIRKSGSRTVSLKSAQTVIQEKKMPKFRSVSGTDLIEVSIIFQPIVSVLRAHSCVISEADRSQRVLREVDLTHWQADTSDATRRGVTLQSVSGSVSGGAETLNLGTKIGYVGLQHRK